MGVAPYTFRNENSVLPAGFKRGSNPPTTATRHCRIQTVLHYRHGRLLTDNACGWAGQAAYGRLTWSMTTRWATPRLTREHSRPGPL